MNAFTAEPEELRLKELAAAERVLRSGYFVLGREVLEFEEAWARYCGLRFCVGVANGLDAIEIGLRAMGVQSGDEVITTPMTAIATVLGISRAGATPVLADVEPEGVLLDMASVDRCITPQTKAVLLVHLYGRMPAMDSWTAFCEARKIDLLEDCAQAHGATWNRRRSGSFGAFGAFSFYPTKNLGARGDSGALVTDSEELAARAQELRNYGARNRYEHPQAGLNSRLDELHAAILCVRLSWLDRFNSRRQEIAGRYLAALDNPGITLLLPPPAESSYVYHLFVVRCQQRDRLAAFLRQRGIETLVHYPIPAHRQGCCRELRCDPHGLPNAERHADECLSIPCHPQLGDDEVESVIAALNAFE
jgi:dTDP-4-amino-4,6-dideoxygalactose transaminase